MVLNVGSCNNHLILLGGAKHAHPGCIIFLMQAQVPAAKHKLGQQDKILEGGGGEGG